jgi:hypothetical protein
VLGTPRVSVCRLRGEWGLARRYGVCRGRAHQHQGRDDADPGHHRGPQERRLEAVGRCRQLHQRLVRTDPGVGQVVAGRGGGHRHQCGHAERAADLLRRVDQAGRDARVTLAHACQRRNRVRDEREPEPDAGQHEAGHQVDQVAAPDRDLREPQQAQRQQRHAGGQHAARAEPGDQHL